MRHTVITGGAGLVGSNLARALLAADAECTIDLLDLDPTSAADDLGSHVDRVRFHAVDLTSATALNGLDATRVTHVVHAAALCHVPDWESQDATRFVDVNVVGTMRLLDWTRTLPRLERVVHVSSGGVYGEPTRWSTPEPQSEDGPFAPPETYAITKLAGEQLARRYAWLHGLDLLVVRLSGVFGPMERATPGRSLMSMPYQIARAITAGRPLAVSARTLDAGGDFLSAVDVADALRRLLECSAPSWSAYNIAFGTFTPAMELLEVCAAHTSQFSWSTSLEPDVDMDPEDRFARWNAYSIDRLRSDTGWAPRPLATQLAEYLDWVAIDAPRRAP